MNGRKPCGRSAIRGGNRRAFTLLEVLIAVVVFSIVLAAINTVFFGALRLRNRATESIDAAQPLQRTLSVIQRDLSNLVVPGGTLSGTLQTTSTTNTVLGQSSPSFYCSTGVIDETSPWAEIERVSYLLVDSTNPTAGRALMRAATRNLLPATAEELPEEQWLMSGVQSLIFTYYDGSQWRDSWDSTVADATTGQTNNLPRAIKVEIQLAPEQGGRAAPTVAPIQLVVPVVIQARTNATQQAGGGGA